MIQISLTEQKLELRFTWKIARGAADFKRNFFVKISDGQFDAIGETAPNVRYGESAEMIVEQFESLQRNGLQEITNHNELMVLFNKVATCNSLRFGIESAFINYWCKRDGISVEKYLGIAPAKEIYTAFTMPIMHIGEMCSFYEEHELQRFKYLKLKINAENGQEALKEISQVAHQQIMIDGNEAFTNADEVLKYIEFLKNYPILFLEQPMPSKNVEDYKYLKPKSKMLIMGDESITDAPDMDAIAQQFHGVNMKLQKAGGYVNGLRILNEARKRNLKTMIGCMVETSVGIGSAMKLCAGVDFIDLDGFMILKEDPFQLIQEKNGELK
ncbi:MAG: dipeptide epimerase [Bacteroidetes bacterium]|nr:dipeptide epimerase [Bacteroidota bacterium]